MKKNRLLVLFLFLFIHYGYLFSCEAILKKYGEKKRPFTITFSGYIVLETFFDSRQIENFLPKEQEKDINCCDINAEGQSDMFTIESRLRSYIKGPKLLGAESFGFIETDFTGPFFVEETDFKGTLLSTRLRHALLEFDWKRTSLLLGRYYHPMEVDECKPDEISFNIPIESNSKNPQIRLTHRWEHFNIIIAGIGFVKSDGPQGRSTLYFRNAIIPNLHSQAQIPINEHLIGIGIDYKRLIPRIKTDKNFKVAELIDSVSALAYAAFHWKRIILYTKVTFGQNLADHFMLGGYAVTSIDPVTDKRTYTNLRSVSFWLETFIKKDTFIKENLEPAIFIGYTKNIGAPKTIIPSITNDQGETTSLLYAAGREKIDYVLKIMPRIRWWYNSTIECGAELGYTRTAYGTVNDQGRVDNPSSVNNVRLHFEIYYHF